MGVLVTGAQGMLGRAVINELSKRKKDIIAVDIREDASRPALNYGYEFLGLDITDESALQRLFEGRRVDAVVHTAAWTDVDGAQLPQNMDRAYILNAIATGNLARLSKEKNAVFIYISTDFVFDGRSRIPYREEDIPNPINHYGYTKLEGERLVKSICEKYYILRTSGLFGEGGKNFVGTICELLLGGKPLEVIDNYMGRPTYTGVLASLICDMSEETDGAKYGIYNASGAGEPVTKYGLACEISRMLMSTSKPEPVSTDMYYKNRGNTPDNIVFADRPEYSVLDNSKLKKNGFLCPEDWRISLRNYIDKNFKSEFS